MDDPVAKIKFFAEFAREVRVLLSDSLGNRFAKKLRYRSEWCINNTCDLGCKIRETCHQLLFNCRALESCSPVVSNMPEFENDRWSTVSAKSHQCFQILLYACRRSHQDTSQAGFSTISRDLWFTFKMCL